MVTVVPRNENIPSVVWIMILAVEQGVKEVISASLPLGLLLLLWKHLSVVQQGAELENHNFYGFGVGKVDVNPHGEVLGPLVPTEGPQDAGAGPGESLQAGAALPSLLVALWDMGQLVWAALGASPGFGVCAGVTLAAQPGRLAPRARARNCSGKWASRQPAGSLALKCWENLKRGTMFVGGRG